MANLENEDTETEETETENDTELDTPEENQEEVDENGSEVVTYEKAIERKRKAERAEKAEKALVERKRAEKEAKRNGNGTFDIREEYKKIRAEERFFEKNPDAEYYRKSIEDYQKKGLSLDESYLLASKKDKEIENNRNLLGKGIIKGNPTSGEVVKTISIKDYDNLTEAQQNKYNSEMVNKYGGIKFKE